MKNISRLDAILEEAYKDFERYNNGYTSEDKEDFKTYLNSLDTDTLVEIMKNKPDLIHYIDPQRQGALKIIKTAAVANSDEAIEYLKQNYSSILTTFADRQAEDRFLKNLISILEYPVRITQIGAKLSEDVIMFAINIFEINTNSSDTLSMLYSFLVNLNTLKSPISDNVLAYIVKNYHQYDSILTAVFAKVRLSQIRNLPDDLKLLIELDANNT